MKTQARQRLLQQLKTAGPQTAAQVAEALGLSAMGAHKQLAQLAEDGLVVWRDEPAGVGRPRRHWQLSEAGHTHFPDRHGELTVQLIQQVRGLFGESGLERLIEAREQEGEQRYRAALTGCRSLRSALQALVAEREREGYMARLERAGADWLLIEDHCPICAAAQACQGFCRSELALFQRCLEAWATVERSEHQLADARRCAYLIRPRRPAASAAKAR